ncbi:MAG TPA: hypothetical protein VIO60_05155, partial [Rectinemataceae bacterium]
SLSLSLQYFLKSFISRSGWREGGLADIPGGEASTKGFSERLAEIRAFIAPMNPPRLPLEEAIVAICGECGERPNPKPPRTRRRRSRAADSEANAPEMPDSPRT